MKRERLIRRYEHNHFYGWVVFAAKRRATMDQVIRFLKQFPPATKVKRTCLRNTTGEIGVALVKHRTLSARWV